MDNKYKKIKPAIVFNKENGYFNKDFFDEENPICSFTITETKKLSFKKPMVFNIYPAKNDPLFFVCKCARKELENIVSYISIADDFIMSMKSDLEILSDAYLKENKNDLTGDAVEFRRVLEEYIENDYIDSYITTKGYLRFNCPYCNTTIDSVNRPNYCQCCGTVLKFKK